MKIWKTFLGIIIGFTLLVLIAVIVSNLLVRNIQESTILPTPEILVVPIRSDEGIDPNECNAIHNIDACTPEELEALGF